MIKKLSCYLGFIALSSIAWATKVGEGLTYYYNFDTNTAATTQKWDDATGTLVSGDASQTISFVSNNSNFGTAGSYQKTNFGEAMSGGNNGTRVYAQTAAWLVPTTEKTKGWTIALWALRCASTANKPSVIMANGLLASTASGGVTTASTFTTAPTDNANVGWGIYYSSSTSASSTNGTGTPIFRFSTTTDGTTFVFHAIQSSKTFTEGGAQTNWNHFAVTLTRGGDADANDTVTLYLNGESVGTESVAKGSYIVLPNGGTSTLYMNTANSGQGQQNAQDDVAIWERALSATEIKYLVLSSKDRTTARPLGTLAIKDASEPEVVVLTPVTANQETSQSASDGWDITEGATLTFTDSPVNLTGKTIKATAVNPASDSAYAVVAIKTSNTTTPFTLTDAILQGNGKLTFLCKNGNGGTRQSITLNVADSKTFTGTLYTANAWDNATDTFLSGEQLSNAAFAFAAAYTGTNPAHGKLNKDTSNTDTLQLTGDATLAGIIFPATTGVTSTVRSSSATMQTLTLSGDKTCVYAGTFGTTANPLSLVCAGTGAQTLSGPTTLTNLTLTSGSLTLSGSTTLTNLTLTSGNLTLSGETAVSGTIAMTAATTPLLTLDSTLTLGTGVSLAITDASITDVANHDFSQTTYSLFTGTGALAAAVKVPCTVNGVSVGFASLSETGAISFGQTFNATITGNTTYSTIKWTKGAQTVTSADLPDNANCFLTVTTDATLTMEQPTERLLLTVLNDSAASDATSKTLTIAGEKLSVTGMLSVQANIVATTETLSAGSIDIAEGKVLTLTSTTVVADPDDISATNSSAITLPPMTGNGKLVKQGVGALAVINRSLEPTIELKAGDLQIRNTPTTRMAITAANGTAVRFTGWNTSYANSLNTFSLAGGARMVLANGPDQTVAGAITIHDASSATPAQIYGSAFGTVTLSGTINGTGTLEFAAGEYFVNTPDKQYKCDYPIVISSVISGAVAVKIADTDALVTMSGANTYTGGTEIVSGSTVAISNGFALGAGTITGAGTISSSVGVSMNATGLNAATWTGTLKLTNDVGFVAANLATYGNAASTIELAGTNTGYFLKGGTCSAKMILSGSMTINEGYSNSVYTFTGPFSGSGTLSASGTPTDTTKFTGDTSAFTGAITVAGGRCVMFGEGARANGTIVVATNSVATIAAEKTWTAVNGIKIAGTVGGTGTLGSATTFANGAVIDATTNTLTEALTVTTPVLENGLVIQVPSSVSMGTLAFKTTAAATDDVAGHMTVQGTSAVMAVTAVGNDYYVDFVSQGEYTRTITTATANWSEENAWVLEGSTTTAAEPTISSAAILTLTQDTTLIVDHPIQLISLTIIGDFHLTLQFNVTDDWVTMEDYRSIRPFTPLTKTLLIASYDPNTVSAELTGLKYAATATMSQTARTITAAISLPIGSFSLKSINVNFTESGKTIADETVDGLYAIQGQHWTQTTSASGTTDIKLYNSDDSTTTTVAGGLTYSSANTWRDTAFSPALLQAYLDDSSGVTVSINVPADFGSYTVLVYASTDTDNTQFSSKTVNGKSYTSVDGQTVLGTTNWGSSINYSGEVYGVNALQVQHQTATTFTLTSSSSTGARGCVAGVQLIQEDAEPILETVYHAHLSGDCTWSKLAWTDDDGNTGAPTETSTVELILGADATLTIDQAATLKSTVVTGNGRALRVISRENLTTAWTFSSDMTYALGTTTESLPETISYPERVRYDYEVTSAYTSTSLYVTEFAKGKTGGLTLSGGTLDFSGGTVQFSNITSGTQTAINFSGTVVVDADVFGVGTATVIFSDTASLSCQSFWLSQGYPGRTSNVIVKDQASITVTGTTNADNNTSSIMLGHWAGSSTLTLRDQATFTSEVAEVTMGQTGYNQTLILEGGTMDVPAIRLKSSASGTNTLTLAGGTLRLGEKGLCRYTNNRQLNVTVTGGTLTNRASFTLDTAIIPNGIEMNGPLTLKAETDTVLTLPAANTWTLGESAAFNVESEGKVVVAQTTLPALTLTRGELELAKGTITLPQLTLKAGMLTLNGAFVKVANGLTLPTGEETITLNVPAVSTLLDGGYIDVGTASIPDLDRVFVQLVLDPERSEDDRILPQLPILLGTYDTAALPKEPAGFGIQNNTNGAITESTTAFQKGQAGTGFYVTLKGAEVLTGNQIDLKQEPAYALKQNVANAYPYLLFNGTEANAVLGIAAGGVKATQLAFVGESMRIVPASTTPEVLLQTKGASFSTNVTFDLSSWSSSMDAWVRGAVRGVPASLCLVTGSILRSPASVEIAVDLGDYSLPEGLTKRVAVTTEGIYLVVESERRARSLSVNFTDAGTPLSAPPAREGVYPIALGAWNSLADVFSATSLTFADMGGGIGGKAMREDAVTQLISYASLIGSQSNAQSSLLKRYIDDSSAQTLKLTHLPFAAYRVVLILSNSATGYAYAPITIGGTSYTMDGEGYTRPNITADKGWGNTSTTTLVNLEALGVNALVSQVMTAEEVTITLPAYVNTVVYGGLAALQIIEAPAVEAVTAKQFAYTTSEAEAGTELALEQLTLTGSATQWESGSLNTLTFNSDVDVTLCLPANFEAASLTLTGTGKLTVKSTHGVALETLDASGITELTLDFDCLGVSYVPASVMTKVQGLFDNNGQAYVIAAGSTLWLTENCGVSTSLDTASPMLSVATTSAGVLRRDGALTLDDTYTNTYNYGNLTLALKSATLTGQNRQMNWLIEDGDSVIATNTKVWHESNSTYTQTGGTFIASKDSGDGDTDGFLFGTSTAKMGILNLSGGYFFARRLIAWTGASSVTVNVTGGTLAIAKELRTNNTAASVAVNVSGEGALEFAGTTFTLQGGGASTITLAGGTLTTSQLESNVSAPLTFAASQETPIKVKNAPMSTLLLSVANTGTGVMEVESGTLAVSHATALGSLTVQVKSGATFEARALTTASGALACEAGSILSVTTTAATPTLPLTAHVAATLSVPEDLTTMTFRLNGVIYTNVTVDGSNGTVTFTTAASVTPVVWAADTGTWSQGGTGPWANAATFYNGAQVTFGDENATTGGYENRVVTIAGIVAPATNSVYAVGTKNYTFKAAETGGILSLGTAAQTYTLSPIGSAHSNIFDVPIATGYQKNTAIVAPGATLRLIGVLSNNNRTATLTDGQNADAENSAAYTRADDESELTFAPHAGEKQQLNAKGPYLKGNGNFTVTGYVAEDGTVSGGTVDFSAAVAGNYNGAFNGKLFVKDGATLAFSMNRTAGTGDGSDERPFFRGTSFQSADAALITLTNGATVNFSGCRGLFGAWDQMAGNDADYPISRKIVIGKNCTVNYAFSTTNTNQSYVVPYGFLLNGDGATLKNSASAGTRKGIVMARGTLLDVAGIGDAGDPADTTHVAEGVLTSGIEAYVTGTSSERGLYIDGNGTFGDTEAGWTWKVGEGSTLHMNANVNTADGQSYYTVHKTGAGKLDFCYADMTGALQLSVDEGRVGGVAAFSHAAASMTIASGASIEAGLRPQLLTLNSGATVYIDPTGVKRLQPYRMLFASAGTFKLELLDSTVEIGAAATAEPVKIIAWQSAQNASQATFTLPDALTEKGYGLEVRTDGLYLKRTIVYTRTLEPPTEAATASFTFDWFAEGKWHRSDAADGEMCNYEPAEEEAVTARIVVPETLINEAGSPTPMIIRLDGSVTVAQVEFVSAKDLTTPLSTAVTYIYDLRNETMPVEGEALTFTWMSTLQIQATGTSAQLAVEIPAGYASTIRDNSVVVYTAAVSLALNVNFGAKSLSDPSALDATVAPAGAVPFAGVYWNNASTASDTIVASSGAATIYSLAADMVTSDADSYPAVTVNYMTVGTTAVASRRTSSNERLLGGFLNGDKNLTPDTTMLGSASMTDAGLAHGWQVRFDAIPMASYDLYIIFASATDGSVAYPAVNLKIGSQGWLAYSIGRNGFVAPAGTGTQWTGQGGPVASVVEEGKNYLHLRIASEMRAPLEIASCDAGLDTASTCGLAAIQIVDCSDTGATFVRRSAGNWSDATGWTLTTAEGDQRTAWQDATAAMPRFATSPMVSSLIMDSDSRVPYLSITSGLGEMSLSGDGAVSVGAIDIGQIDATAKMHFEMENLVGSTRIILAPEVTYTVYRNAKVAKTVDWTWVYNARPTNAQTSTLQKSQSADLTITSQMYSKLLIDEGTLWLQSNADYSRSQTIAGNGTLGKTGSGTLTQTGEMSNVGQDDVAIRVSEGQLNLNKAVGKTMANGRIFIAENSGSVLWLNNNNSARVEGYFLPESSTLYARNGGTIYLANTNQTLRDAVKGASAIAENGGTMRIYTTVMGYGPGAHIHLANVTLRNGNLLIDASTGWTSWANEGLNICGNLLVESGLNNTISRKMKNTEEGKNAIVLRPTDSGAAEDAVTVVEGAKLTTSCPIKAASGTFVKRGTGTWAISGGIAAKEGSCNTSSAFDVKVGALEFALGDNGTHWPADLDDTKVTTYPITVASGASLGGRAKIAPDAPVVIEAGGTIRSGTAAGEGLLTISALTLQSGAIIECNLANALPLTVAAVDTGVEPKVALPSSLIVKLTNFASYNGAARQLVAWPVKETAPTIEITSAEAIALDAGFEVRADGIYLVSSRSAYNWTETSGNWSDAAWTTGTNLTEKVTFPTDASAQAMVKAQTADVTLTVDKPSTSTSAMTWNLKSLVLATAEGQALTVQQSADTNVVNTLELDASSSLWKMDAGTATLDTRLQLAGTGGAATSLQIVAGTLKLQQPLFLKTLLDNTRNAIQTPMAISEGATLRYELPAIAGEDTNYPLNTQTLSGALSGDGTIAQMGAGTLVITSGAGKTVPDSNLNYAVGAGSTLTLSADVAESALTASRTLTVAKNATVALMKEKVLGHTPNWTLNLEAAAQPDATGAIIQTSNNARLRGLVRTTLAAGETSGTASLGTSNAFIDGNLTFDTAESTTLTLAGEVVTPTDCTTGTLTKTGKGSLVLDGLFESNLPLTLQEGTVSVKTDVGIVNNNSSATQADWTVQSGAKLALGARMNLSGGLLSIAPGATLAVTGSATMNNALTLDGGAIVAMGAGKAQVESIPQMTITGSVTLLGTVVVNLDDFIDPPAVTTASTAYTLITIGGSRLGSGTFQLGGEKLLKWISAGWTLQDSTTSTSVKLVPFGNGNDTYTWRGLGTSWSTEAGWVKGTEDQGADWPSPDVQDNINEYLTPAVKFVDKDPLDTAGVVITAANRMVDWPYAKTQTLSAFSVENNAPTEGSSEGDYTLTASGDATNLNINNDFIKRGDAKLTVRRPVRFRTNTAALKLIGGKTEFADTLAFGDTLELNIPYTLVGDASMILTGNTPYVFAGLFQGDGTGTIEKQNRTQLTFRTSVEGLKTLALTAGETFLKADETTITPVITLESDATLTYAPDSVLDNGETVSLSINPAKDIEVGSFKWAASSAVTANVVPTLAPLTGATTPAMQVAEFIYAPVQGHLALKTDNTVFGTTTCLNLNAAASATTALWLRATDVATPLTVGSLLGTGMIAAEPAGTTTDRTLRIAMPVGLTEAQRTFSGTVASTTANATTYGMTLEVSAVDETASEKPRFNFAGTATTATTLKIDNHAEVSVSGSWAGDVSVVAGGTLSGSGSVMGAVDVPKDGILVGSVYTDRLIAANTYQKQVVPSTLTLNAVTLADKASLRVLVRKDYRNGDKPWVSLVNADTLTIPIKNEEGGSEIHLNVILDIEEGAYTGEVKILGWNTLNGSTNLFGTVYNSDGTVNTTYTLRKKSDGLYLKRTNARYWIFVQ